MFKNTDGDELRAFQNRVLGLLEEFYPERRVSRTDDPHTIIIDGQTYGLSNARSNFLLSPQSVDDFRDLVKGHFESVFAGVKQLDRDDRLPWEAVKTLLMPQLMPVSFVDRMPVVALPLANKSIWDLS